jgi:hypothetical protein
MRFVSILSELQSEETFGEKFLLHVNSKGLLTHFFTRHLETLKFSVHHCGIGIGGIGQ